MDDKVLRNYLLGRLNESTQEEVEAALAEGELFDHYEMLEEEIIEDYISGDLSADDRQSFEQTFAKNEARVQKIRLVNGLTQYANLKTVLESEDPVTPVTPVIDKRPSWKSICLIILIAGLVVYSIGTSIIVHRLSTQVKALEEQVKRLTSNPETHDDPTKEPGIRYGTEGGASGSDNH